MFSKIKLSLSNFLLAKINSTFQGTLIVGNNYRREKKRKGILFYNKKAHKRNSYN